MYNYLGELCSLILSAVLLFNTINSFSLREKKHLYFFFCIVCIMLSTFSNIISIYCIEHFDPNRIVLSTIITTTYFVLLELIPFFFTIYCYEFVSPHKRHKKQFLFFSIIPVVINLSVLALNPFFNLVFKYDLVLGYTRGSLKNITYVTMVYYAVLILRVVYSNRSLLSKRTKIVFMIYPFLGIAIIMIQFFSTYFVMTGTSSLATVLLVYLSIQSDLLEYEIQTGLLTEKHLERVIDKKPEGVLAVISIENFSTLEGSLSIYSFNKLILDISTRLYSLFVRSAYHISANKFAVLASDLESLKTNIQKFLAEFEQIQTEDNTNHFVEFIVASVDMPANAENYAKASEVINDLLMTARKKKGQRFICCDENYLAERKRIQEIYTILDRELNLESEQFQIYFQPIYSISEDKFVYAEALSRLMNTELGDISPAEFVAVAESKGLIERLGNTVFEKICDFISKNKDTVKAVSVNFSVYQLVNPGIVNYVINTIKRFGLKPENVIIEMTESIFVDDFDLIKKHMMELSKEGFIFYLDDFGTGYSNFANVIALPFSTIKIDRSFVLMMETNEALLRLTKSLIHTFKENGLKILVEGVETPSQDKMIKDAETDYIQGFLYSRPIPADKFLEIISK